MRARQRLSKLLLRHDVRYEDTTSRWGERHRHWLAQIDLGQAGAQATMADYVGAVEALELRRGTLEAAIAALVPTRRALQAVARLRRLRGIDTLSRRRAGGRDRRLRAFRATRAADGLCRAGARLSTAPARPAARGTSPSPAHSTPAGCWSRRRGITAAHLGWEPRCSAASKTKARSWSRSRGKPTSRRPKSSRKN